MSAASPMIKSTKGWRRERKELVQLELHTFPSEGGGMGGLCFILEFLLDFRKYNIMILVIISPFSYQELVLPYQGLMLLRHMRFGHWEIRG